MVTESLYDVFTGCWPEGEILGVDRNADSKAIKNQIALTMHPDKMKNPTQEDKDRYMEVRLSFRSIIRIDCEGV